MDRQFVFLTRHFFSRFFDRENRPEDASHLTGIIQLLVLLALPGLMISIFLLPDHPPGSGLTQGATTELGRMWLRVGDRYVFVCYAMVVMGLIMTFKWDSLFPDRRDYLILTSLPISVRKVFAAKVVALIAFLGLFVLTINLFPLLVVPGIYSKSSSMAGLLQAIAGHAMGTAGGSIFAALFFASLQGVLINILTPSRFRRISPWIQMISMSVLVTILLITPLIKESIRPLSQQGSKLLDYFPFVWFLGLYESFLPKGTLMPSSYMWGWTAIQAMAVVLFFCAITYFAGYRRYARKILESVDSDAMAPGWWRSRTSTVLDRTILKTPQQRATFHFIGNIAGRSPKHRILTALYIGVGLALALSSLFAFDRRWTGAFPFHLSTMGLLEGPIILSFLAVAGLRAAFNVPYELASNWMFQITAGSDSTEYLSAVRKWLFVCRILPLYALISVCEFLCFDPITAAFHLLFDLLVTAILIEVFFLNFNKVPFTCSYPENKFQLALLAAGYLYGFTTYVQLTGHLKGAVTAGAMRMLIFAGAAAALLIVLGLYRRRRETRIIYDEAAASLVSLSADHGYWRTPITAARPARRSREDDIEAEINAHLEMATRDRIARGESPLLARAAARREFGNVTQIRETTRSVWRWTTAEQLLQDARIGSRILWKSPAISLTSIILIALVIGGNTTIYSMVHALISKSAPGVTAEGLVSLTPMRQRMDFSHSYPDFRDYAAQSKTLRPLMAYAPERFTVGVDSGSYSYYGGSVDEKFFETLGVRLLRGRTFTAGETRLDASGLVAVISHRLWQERFDAAENVLGSPITVNGYPATVIGVAPQHFQGAYLANPEDIWVPLLSFARLSNNERLVDDRSASLVAITGRMAPGVSFSEVQAEFATISARLKQAHPDTGKDRGAVPVRYAATTFGGLQQSGPVFLAIFSVVTMLTLFIVCANVANLMLSRAVARQRETAVRQSLGASRIRILRVLLAEGLTISLIAWAMACVMADWFAKGILKLIPDATNPMGLRSNHLNMDFSPDWRVLAYAMLLAVIGTLVFTIGPSVRAWRRNVLPDLKAGDQSVAQGRSWLSSVLVVAQLGFTVVLLTTSGLAYRSFSIINDTDLGFNTDNLLLVTVNPTLGIRTADASAQLIEELRRKIRAVRGVSSVSHIRFPIPYSGIRETTLGNDPQKPVKARTNYVGPDYFQVLGLHPIAGREFSADDRIRSASVAIINHNLAEELWPGQAAVGRTMLIGSRPRPVEVVGVAPDISYSGFEKLSRPNFIFLAEQQDRSGITGRFDLRESGETTFYVRYSGALDTVAPGVISAIHQVDSRIAVVYSRTMNTQLETITLPTRLIITLLTLFSVTSLVIAVLGQYAVVSFNMKRRTREFGVRVAMGASSRHIVRSVLKEGLVLTAAGLALGFALSLAAGVGLRSLLYGVTPSDSLTYVGVSVLLTAASMLACYVPARRASHVDPLVALRYE
jgi:predicted permease